MYRTPPGYRFPLSPRGEPDLIRFVTGFIHPARHPPTIPELISTARHFGVELAPHHIAWALRRARRKYFIQK